MYIHMTYLVTFFFLNDYDIVFIVLEKFNICSF